MKTKKQNKDTGKADLIEALRSYVESDSQMEGSTRKAREHNERLDKALQVLALNEERTFKVKYALRNGWPLRKNWYIHSTVVGSYADARAVVTGLRESNYGGEDYRIFEVVDGKQRWII